MLGVEVAIGIAQAPAAHRDQADPAPQPVACLEDLGHHLLRGLVALALDGARVGVLDLGPPGLELRDRAPDALEHVERFEARDHDRHLVFGRDRLVLPVAHDAADVPGRQECLDAVARRGEQGRDGRRDEHVRDEHREVRQAKLFGLEDGHGVGRCRGLKADAEEHDLTVGVLARQFDGIERRVDDSHITAAAFDREQILTAPRHTQHVAERTEDHARLRGDGQRLIDHLERRDAHRAARAVDQLDLVRKQLVDAVADDRVRLAAADLHQRPRAGDRAPDLVKQALGDLGITEFVEVLHPATGAPPCESAFNSSFSTSSC